jgi:general secretion pathway protein A
MYESHFGFHRQPFQAGVSRTEFFSSESFRKIVPQLLHAMRSDLGVGILTGPAGCGKTTLLRHLRQLLVQNGRASVCSGITLADSQELLRALWNAAGQGSGKSTSEDTPGRGEYLSRWRVAERLERSAELWGPAILLIDDGHLVPVNVLNELRAFTDEVTGNGRLVRSLLSGPLSFEDDLARPQYSDFSHRIRCHVFLQPLTLRESVDYLQMKLKEAGGTATQVLTPRAIDLIVAAADGSPHSINLLTDETFVVAAERNQKPADERSVREAFGRLRHLPCAWGSISDDDASVLASSSEIQYEPDRRAVEPAKPAFVRVPSEPVVVESVAGRMAGQGLVASGTEAGRAFFEFGAPSPADSARPTVEEMPAAVVVDSVVEIPEQVVSVTADTCIEVVSVGEQTVDQTFEQLSAGSGLLTNNTSPGCIEFTASTTPRAEQQSEDCRPVFDRYTWVSLGREVPPSESAIAVSRIRALALSEPSVYVLTGSGDESHEIPIVNCSDSAITALLLNTGSPAESESGVFAVHSPGIAPQSFSSIPQMPISETPADRTRFAVNAAVESLDDRRESIIAGENYVERWNDGQLLKSTRHGRSSDRIASEPLTETSAARSVAETTHETVSIPFRAAVNTGGPLLSASDAMPQDHQEPVISALGDVDAVRTSADRKLREQIQADELKFYTLSVPVVSSGTLRSETRLTQEFTSIAETVAGLQADVERFRRDEVSVGAPEDLRTAIQAVETTDGSRISEKFAEEASAAGTSDDGLRFSRMFTRLRKSRENI